MTEYSDVAPLAATFSFISRRSLDDVAANEIVSINRDGFSMRRQENRDECRMGIAPFAPNEGTGDSDHRLT